MALPNGVLFTEPRNQPLSTGGQLQPGAIRKFFLSGTTTFANVYQDGALTLVYPQNVTPITADAFGRFPVVYLDPAVQYRVQLLDKTGVTVLEDTDPYITTAPAGFYSAVKAALTTISNSTVQTADPDLQIAIPAAGTYEFDLLLNYSTPGASGTTPGVAFDVAYSGTVDATKVAAYAIVGQANAAVSTAYAVGTGGNPTALVGANANNTLHLHGVLTVTTAGVLQLTWAQETSSANATVLAAGCAMTVQRVS